MSYNTLKFPANSKFLVTGGAGFIGSNLCEVFLKLGYRVRCLDDLSTGKQSNVDLFKNHPNYEFLKGDIKDVYTCMAACKDVDYVLNQAAWGSVPRSIEMPLFYCANNIQGTLNMLEAARQNGVKKFVYASSSSVYGDEVHLPTEKFDAAIAAVAHKKFEGLDVLGLLKDKHVISDVKDVKCTLDRNILDGRL